MIYDKLQNIERYLGISQLLDEAINYIVSEKYTLAEFGKNIIKGDEIYYNCPKDAMAKNTKDMDFEYHKKYIDIHIPIKGEEYIGYFHKENGIKTKDYDEKDDYALMKGEMNEQFLVKEGEFLILFPDEVHLALMKVNEEKKVHKVIFKVLDKR